MMTDADIQAAAKRYGVSADVLRALLYSDAGGTDLSHLTADNLDAAAHLYADRLQANSGDQYQAVADYKGVASMTADKAKAVLDAVSVYLPGDGTLPDKLRKQSIRDAIIDNTSGAIDPYRHGSRFTSGAFWAVAGTAAILALFAIKNLIDKPKLILQAMT